MNDIRSFIFKKIKNRDFQKSKAGHKFIQKILVTIGIYFTVILTAFIPFLAASLLISAIYGLVDNNDKLGYSIVYLFIAFFINLYCLNLILVLFKGFDIFYIFSIISPFLLITIVALGNYKDPEFLTQNIVFILSIGIAYFAIYINSFLFALTAATSGIYGLYVAFIWCQLITLTLIKNNNPQGSLESVIFTFIAALGLTFTGTIIAHKALKGDPKFAWIKEKAIFWAATGGTSFYGVDLTDVSFDNSHLPHTDFRNTILTRTSFKNVTGLELSRLQGTILEDPKVRKLLTTKQGKNQDYTGTNLNGANLTGANLTDANLTGANLNGASLKNADLTSAILTEINALDTDFSGATLTDACIQEWNINKNTRFQNVICKRIYLKCEKQENIIKLSERKPDGGEFKEGEFEKWIIEIQNTVDLIFQNGLNWKAFAFSLAQTAIDHPGLDLSRYSLQNKGEGCTVTKIGITPDANPEEIYHALIENYQTAVHRLEQEKQQLTLQAKQEQIDNLRNYLDHQWREFRELVNIFAENTRNLMIQGEGNRIYMIKQAGDIMESKKEGINVGGNMTIGGDNMTLTGASIIGDLNNVTNTIQQLHDIKTEKTEDLVKILTNLKDSIANDSQLTEPQKKEALEAVQTIAEEAKKPAPERTLKYCSMALNALKGITSAVTDASKLAEVFKTCLPTLTTLLGL